MTMGLGWGSLKHMNDMMKYNRALLGKKKSVREIYKEEIRKRETTYSNKSLEFIRLRVAERLRRDRGKELVIRIVAIMILVLFLFALGWTLMKIDFTWKKPPKYADKSKLFRTVIYKQSDGLDLKIDYFVHGSRAAETFLKDGLKHQSSESYYETGEQFRSALYYYDSLVAEVYLYKTGDTIANFPNVRGDQVHTIKLKDDQRRKEIEFDFYDGKIIQGTYKENNLN